MPQTKKRYEAVIAAMERALREELARVRENIAIERSADEVDARVGLDARDMDTVRLMRASRLLEQLRAARKRLREGTFGICEACGEDIAPKRLAVVPWAECCVSCQERRDQELPPGAPPSEYEHGMVEVR